MATITERFGFTKPAGSDPASVVPLNSNTDLIELYLGRTQDMIAPMYDDTATYDVGDIVTYESRLYKCITAISTAETFDPTKWKATTAVEEGSGGGGGSSVIPNPTGTPTDTLSTVSIDGTIFNIEGSGGGGGEGYTETTIWSGSESTNKWVEPIVLNDVNVDEYDALAIQVNVSQHIISTEQIPTGDASASSVIALNGFLNTNGESVVSIWLNKGNNLLRIFTATNVTIVLTKVVGIKYATGGGGASEGEGVEIYSESEYIVGKWIDGKKLYQRTYHLAQAITIAGGGSWTNTGIDISDISILVDSKFSQDVAVWDAINGINDNGTLKATILASGSLTVDTITIRYTKTVETPAPAWGGSVTNNYANFIDTDNVIDSGVYNPTTPLSYTATEDCFVVIALIANNNPCIVSVDNKEIYRIYDNGIGSITVPVPMKKGQTITATTSYSAEDSPYTVYGISYASGGSETPATDASEVEYDNTTSQLTADNVQEAIDEAVANADTASEDILTLQNVQGYDAYDETQTYAVGDYAIYNNHVYECTTAVSTAEPFDSSKWTATSIEQIIDGVKGDVSQLNSSIIQYRMVQMNITTQTVNPQGGATLLNAVDFTTSTMIDTFSNQTLAQLFSGKTILGAHFMWTNGSGSASVSEFVDNNKVTIGVMNVSSVQLAYSAVRVAVWYR